MPLPKPRGGEKQDAFMARCMHEAYGPDAPSDRTQEQAVAMCFSQWRETHGGEPPKKADDDKKPKKPYGDVAYADPGYQEDKKPRYPIDTEDHIRAAWSYINQAKNQEPYSADQVAKIKARIVAAWKDKIDSEGPPSAKDDKKGVAGMVQKQRDDDDHDFDVPEPDDDENENEFMDRCIDELVNNQNADNDEAENECQIAWATKSAARSGVVQKTHTSEVHGMDFVLSDDTVDRMGDIVSAGGWDLTSFKRNPVALFNHNPGFIVGQWRNLRVEGNELRGNLKMAPEGTSPRIDEIRKLVEAGILRAVSVGFRPIESDMIDKKNPFGGQRYSKQELVETSLVAIPANANALAVAKSLRISPATIEMVFAEQGNQNTGIKRRGFNGGKAETTRDRRSKAMSGLGQRIAEAQTQLVALQDELEDHLGKMDDSNVSDADMEKTSTLNAGIMQKQKTLTMLQDSEKALAKSLNGGGDGSNGSSRSRALTTTVLPPTVEPKVTVPAAPKSRQPDLLDYIVRAGAVAYACKSWGRQPDETRQKIADVFPEYGDEATKAAVGIIMRAASAPAMTTVTGWAQELVRTQWTDLMPLLLPNAILTRLAGKGLNLSFGATGRIVIPTRNRTPSLAGSFVGEGLAIPVRQGAFSSQTLTPKKLAVISTWTREMDVHSIPAIEGLIREAITQDTSVAVDTVLIDNNPATAIRPAGLLNGVAATTATAGGGLAALIGDIKALIQALVVSTYGNLRAPVWLMNPSDVLSASLQQATNTGIFPFKDEIARGTLNNIPIIDSSTVPVHTTILVDAADFVVVGGEAPRMEISDQATLHMEDTNPTDLVASPSTVAAPQRSLFQTDSLALRMVMPLNWVQRRAGTVSWTQTTTWS